MRVAIVNEPGIQNLTVVERPDPEPKYGEVLVRMRAATLNYRDLLTVEGGYGSKQRTIDFIPLSDGAGIVTEVGEGVNNFKTGDRVVGNFFQEWLAGEPNQKNMQSGLGGVLDGVASEYRVFPEHGLCHTPNHLTDAEAAALPCAALTAWSAIVDQGHIKPGDIVITQGTGGVSVFALQFAKLSGAQVIATSSSDVKLDRISSIGADHTINYIQNQNWAKSARDITNGRGVDLVVEVGGAGTLEQSIKAVRPGGAVCLIGVLSGSNHEFRLPLVVTRKIRLEGVTCGSLEQFQNMLRSIDQHKLRPALDEKLFSLDELPAAFEYMRNGKHFGKIAINI
jgi:NADPH:quinone reductase-like Zn-dependent oxidoreductase